MKLFLRFVILFFVLSIVTALLIRNSEIDFGIVDYWNRHGFLLLVFLATFPRLALLFSSIASGGILWWLAWLFAPRLLVAVLATIAYWQTNPYLVTTAWLIALFGESGEKAAMRKQVKSRQR